MYENKLLKCVHDNELIHYYYLNYSIDELIERLHSLKFSLVIGDKSFVPFNAQLRDYIGAVDNENNKWLAKKVNKNELFDHILFELAYYIDFMMQTLAIPSLLVEINNEYYRIAKLVHGIQIGSYNYIKNPFLKVLTNDLINRWLYFDEDRNPNNYMVIHNSKNEPLVVAIDYNKVDLKTTTMKITGNDEKFGWFRQEKTRFLTLLKPSNFENLTIDNFNFRLDLMMCIKENKLRDICMKLFKNYFDDYASRSEKIVSNILKRRVYINAYFKKWFKTTTKKSNETSDYSGLGKSFLKIFKEK